MSKTAAIIVPGAADALTAEKPPTIWTHGVALAPKWRYSLVKPGSWRGLLRGRLPAPGRAATKVSELARWNSRRWPGAVTYLVIPTGRKLFWQQVVELARSLAHQEITAVDWPGNSRRWSSWAAKLRPGDLVIIDDTLAVGQRLVRRLATQAAPGAQLAGAAELLPELRAFQPNEHRLVLAPDQVHDSLRAVGIGDAELAGGNIFDRLRRELTSREPDSILLIQAAPDTDDRLQRFKMDDELTRLTQLLDQHGYGVRVIGAPDRVVNRGAWPVIDWSAGQKARLPAGWERRHATLRHAKQALRDQLA